MCVCVSSGYAFKRNTYAGLGDFLLREFWFLVLDVAAIIEMCDGLKVSCGCPVLR